MPDNRVASFATRYNVYDNDACCEDCRKHQVRDVACRKCGELWVTDQQELDAGYDPECECWDD